MNLKKKINIPNKYILDSSGKSDALFFKSKNSNDLCRADLNFLKKYYSLFKKEVRICLHNNLSEELQTMINLIHQKKKYEIHYHNYSSEYYKVIEGKLKLLVFKKNFKINKVYSLTKHDLIGKIKRGEYHVAVPETKTCIYLEFRSGNFKKHKNIFCKKSVSLKKALSV